MSEFAGVDPHRIRRLADRLQALATALAKDGGIIRTNFKEWGGGLDLSVIAQQAEQVAQDAHDMGLRADEALNLLHASPGYSPGAGYDYAHVKSGMFQIPWDVKDVDPAKEARQESAELKKALDNPKAQGAGEVILDVAQSMAEHQGDSAYMTAFMVSGGIDETVQAANALHAEDGTHGNAVLSRSSTLALSRFGQVTQVMSGLAAAGKYPHPAPDYLAPLTHPSDDNAWSVGMLVKYGPAGDKWDPRVLADISGGLLDWRDKQGAMRPVYEVMPGGGAPPAYYGDGKAWFDRLGIGDVTYAGADADRRIAAIRANDPVLAALDKLGDNPQGSRDLLGQDTADAKRHALQLLDYKWQTTGREGAIDDSGPVADVLNAAATDRSPAFRDQSGVAASNILEAAAKENSVFAGRSQQEQREYVTYPENTAVALAGITATWADQIGSKSMFAGPDSAGYDVPEHGLVVPHTDMVSAMQLFVRDDPDAAALFDTAMHHQLSDAVAEKNSKDSSDDVAALGNMVGLFTKAKNGVSYSNAQQIDEQHKYDLAVVNTAGVLFGGSSLPKGVTVKLVTKGFKYTQTLATWGRSVKAPTTGPFSTNNAAAQDAVNSDDADEVQSSFTPAIAQGLIQSGRMKEPSGKAWYDPKTKTVRPEASNDKDFVSWFAGNNPDGPKDGPVADFGVGYGRYEVQRRGH